MDLPEDPQSLVIEALEWYLEDRQVCASEQEKHGNNEDAAVHTEEAKRAGAVLGALRQGRISVCETTSLDTTPIEYEAMNYGRDGYEEQNTASITIDPSERTTRIQIDLGDRHVDLGLEVNEEDVLLVVSRTDETNDEGEPCFGDSDGTVRVKAHQTVAESMLDRTKRVSLP